MSSNWRENLGRRLPDPVRKAWQNFIRPVLPDWSFITIHYTYYLVVCLVTSLIFWGASKPSKAVSYTDSLFLVISAMTETGLNTVNLSQITTFQQVLLFFLMLIGSAIWVSVATVLVRKRAFEHKLQELAETRSRRLKLSKTFQLARTKTSQLTFSKPSLFSRSKPTCNTKDEKEASTASSSVSGGPLAMSDRSPLAAKSPRSGAHITFNAPDKREAVGEPAQPDASFLSPHLNHQPNQSANQDHQSIRSANQDRLSLKSPYLATGTSSFIATPGFGRTHTRIFSGRGVGVRPTLDNHPRNAMPLVLQTGPKDGEGNGLARNGQGFAIFDKYLKGFNGFVGRNSQFHGLTEKERRKLGGLEYDALVLLSYLVPAYFFLIQFLGAVGMGAWIHVHRPDMARENGLNPFWTGAFFAVSAFNNAGMSLLDANASALQNSYYSLLTLGFLILAGNTCFPPFLRLVIWTIKVCISRSRDDPKWNKAREVLQFVLDHPRRCYTHLFPAAQTWWLVGTLVLLNSTNWVAYEIMNIGNPAVESLPGRTRVLVGFFQALAVRKGGFLVTALSNLRPALHCLYIYMMYVSDLPVTLTIRNTNVYEERSLGIFAEEVATAQPPAAGPSTPEALRRYPTMANLGSNLKRRLTGQLDANSAQPDNSTTTFSRSDFLSQQIRSQLSHDLWWIAGAIMFITMIETSQYDRDPAVFSVLNIIFECVSAYGCVGLSVGVPWNTYSFCGAWHTGSKILLCGVMLRGRHRGLPVAIDRAVLVPDETLGWAEEEDAAKRARAMTMISEDVER